MEKSNKRRYTLMVISFLFLLVATFVTVYNFKNTRAEETEAAVKISTIATCKGDGNFGFRSDGISGCEMTAVKNISGFQLLDPNTNEWVDFTSFTLDDEYGIKKTNELVTRYKSKYPLYSDTEPWGILVEYGLPLISYDYIGSSTICYSDTFCCAFKLQGINSYESQRFRNKGNFHMIFNRSNPNDSFKGEFIYAFPSTDITDPDIIDVGRENLTINYYDYENECKYAYNQPLVKVTIDDRGSANSMYYQVSDLLYQTADGSYKGGNVYIKYIPLTREGYVFDGFDSNVGSIGRSSNNYYKLPITSDETAVLDSSQKTYKMIERKLTVKWRKLTSTTVTFDFNAPSNVSSGNCTCEDSVLGKICFAFDNNPEESFEYVVSAGSSIQLPTIRCPGINKKIKDWSGKIGNFKPTEDITLVANWVPINSGNTPSNDEYTVTLNRNCSGTFVCNSTTNSEVCTQLKNNGKFTKTFTKGDTFVFPKTFDTLTCDGKEISSWGSFDLGYELNVTSDVTASAKWKSSSGGGNTPSNDEYTVTLNRNCSGTFVCNSTTNSEVCTQLKNNGKFTKTVTKGDTIIFPKKFDALTCDGKEISSWGSYSLGTKITVNNNIYLDAVWESSNGGGDTPDPSQNDDPIDNPQTGSIVIYLVLLFGIGALVYSVWYFRGFREN